MIENGFYPIYVTVGFVLDQKPIVKKQKVMVNDRDGETPVQAANKLKMALASDKRSSALLYFEIYAREDSTSPYAASTNSPAVLKELHNGQ